MVDDAPRATGRWAHLGVHLVGGPAVLGSYYVGLSGHPGEASALWGSLPDAAWWPYSTSMPFAALGYLAVLALILGSSEEAVAQDAGGWGRLSVGFGAMLACCTAWMPLCWALLDGGPDGLWWAIQGVLAGTAAVALWVLAVVWRLTARLERAWLRRLVRAGWLAFCWQTVMLDALIWPRFFGG